MAKGGESTAVPRLRFQEFRKADGWASTALGLEAKFYKGRGISKAEIDPRGSRPCIRYGELYTRYGEVIREVYSRTNIAPSELFLSEENDVVVPSSGETKEDIATASCVMLTGVALGSDLNVIRTSHNGPFLSYYLNGALRRQIAKVAQGDAVVHLYPSQLEGVSAAFPRLNEQQKIAECLTSLEEVIVAQQRKVKALKKHKRGLMQQLFPGEGEAVPRLRFPEFRDGLAWQFKEVGEIFKVTRGEVLSMKLVQDRKAGTAQYPVYSSQTTNGGLAGYYSDFLYEDAITWTTDGANAGDVNFRPGKFYCTNVCGVLLSDERFANPCIAALLNSVSRSYVSYVGNPKLMNGVMSMISIPFPSLVEQQRISNYLSSFDTLIIGESAKLDTLKAHKKGLMQQLFPVMDAVIA